MPRKGIGCESNHQSIRKVAKNIHLYILYVKLRQASTIFPSHSAMSPFQAKRLAQPQKKTFRSVAFGFILIISVFFIHSFLSAKVFILLFFFSQSNTNAFYTFET